MPGLPDPMFHVHATHAEVRCWSCKHVAIVKPGDVPSEMSVWEFQRRAKCLNAGRASLGFLSCHGLQAVGADYAPSGLRRYMTPLARCVDPWGQAGDVAAVRLAAERCGRVWRGWQDLNLRSRFWRPELWARLSYTDEASAERPCTV